MLDFYFHATNSMKVALLLEELDVPYTVKPVDIFKGEQHVDWFRQINPAALRMVRSGNVMPCTKSAENAFVDD